MYLHLIIGILSLCISTHLTVSLLLNPVLNLIFSLLPIVSCALESDWPARGRSQGARYRTILDGIVRYRAVCERSFRSVQVRCRAGPHDVAEIELQEYTDAATQRTT